MYNCCNDVNKEILLGIVPASLLVLRNRRCKDVNDPILLGIVPFRLLVSSSRYCKDVNDPILLGIVPTSDMVLNKILVTLAYVADPLTVPHVTP